jgi:hypothetical protein
VIAAWRRRPPESSEIASRMRDQHGDAGNRGRRQRADQCGLDEGN